ncbi:MAG: hypothetical protein C5S46_02600 [Candidatus Methanomarinus sp.]|uniref:Uncharacterized protein n=1 Tax=Candidatus Methanomarinus sp. TaxID=3386244 RepID=A0AC61SBR1_9EURY|nr:MAG: hypothetical protein C5S46_02600 [ANME-2 cluster archaeon]
MQRELKEGVVGYYERNFLSLKNSASKVSGHQVVIMEVLIMVGKLLKNILPDKKENRMAEVHKQALDLSPGYSDLRPKLPKTPFNIIKCIK